MLKKWLGWEEEGKSTDVVEEVDIPPPDYLHTHPEIPRHHHPLEADEKMEVRMKKVESEIETLHKRQEILRKVVLDVDAGLEEVYQRLNWGSRGKKEK